MFFLAYFEGKPVGYLKLRQGRPPICVSGPNPIELERNYVISKLAGMGIGGCLKAHALAEARDQGYKTIWLGVWKENHQASQVYQHGGLRV